MDLPKTIKAWQYGAISGGIEKSLKLNTSASMPAPKRDQHLIKIHSVSLNPVDYKPAEVSLFRRIVVPNPATPGIDFSGTIVKPAKGTAFKVGDKVFGCGPSPFAGGCLAEYAVAGTDATVAIPEGVTMEHASTIGVAGLTAYQTIEPHVKSQADSRVFLNGGSGGVGVFGIQIAKALGCDVITTCSSRNTELCRSLGADEVVDYTQYNSLPKALIQHTSEKKVDHIVDNVGADPSIYWKAHEYSTAGAKFISVAGSPSVNFLLNSMKMKFLPGWLGGGKRKVEGFFAKPNVSDLERIAKWMAEGKVKAVVDQTFAFGDAPKAFEKLKTGRARGKIVVTFDGNN